MDCEPGDSDKVIKIVPKRDDPKKDATFCGAGVTPAILIQDLGKRIGLAAGVNGRIIKSTLGKAVLYREYKIH